MLEMVQVLVLEIFSPEVLFYLKVFFCLKDEQNHLSLIKLISLNVDYEYHRIEDKILFFRPVYFGLGELRTLL